MKKVLTSDPANTEEDMGFWWNVRRNPGKPNESVESVAAVTIDPTGLRFDGRDFTVEIARPGEPNESVEVVVGGVVVFRSVKSKAS